MPKKINDWEKIESKKLAEDNINRVAVFKRKMIDFLQNTSPEKSRGKDEQKYEFNSINQDLDELERLFLECEEFVEDYVKEIAKIGQDLRDCYPDEMKDNDTIKDHYHSLELEYVKERYGDKSQLMEIVDPGNSFKLFIKNKSQKLRDPKLFNYHIQLQAKHADIAMERWQEFIGTGDMDVFEEYIRNGGEVDRAVRLVILSPPSQKHLRARRAEWWDFRRVETIMKTIDPKTDKEYTFLQACTTIAFERHGESDDMESKIKTIQNHVKSVEARFDQKLPRLR